MNKKQVTVLEAARLYLDIGIEPVVVQPHKKSPVANWKTATPITADNVTSRFGGDVNIGIMLGRRSDGLVDVDLDCPEAILLASFFLPPTGRKFGRSSTPAAHWLYRSDLYETEDVADIKFKYPKTKEVLVEIRIGAIGTDGGDLAAMTVAPPSVYADGEQSVWSEQGDIPTIEGGELKLAVTKLAIGSLLLRFYANNRGRHDFWLVVDGYLARNDWSSEDRRHLIEAVATVAGDDEIKDRLLIVKNTDKKLLSGGRIYGLTTMRKELGEDIADRIDEWVFIKPLEKTRTENRVEVRLDIGMTDVQAGAIEDALVAAEAPIYLQGNTMVRVVVKGADASLGRKTLVAQMIPCDVPWLLRETSKVVYCTKRRRKDWYPVELPQSLMTSVLSSASHKFRELKGIVETPIMRADGSLLVEPGYDHVTGLLLVNPPPMPTISDAPTRRDAEAALFILDSLLDEFPFVDAASRSVALSALMTPVVRTAMATAPMHVIDAPTPGSGKSYLLDTVAAISTGKLMPTSPVSRNDEENNKHWGGTVLSGQSLVSLDNINGILRGDFLCQVLTQTTVEIRRLGSTGNTTAANCASWFANGNNIEIEGDLIRRSIRCSLDADVENPENRRFVGDPVQTVLGDRGKYVAAVFTVIRAFIMSDDKPDVAPFVGFREWSQTVRSALIWMGRSDPISTQEALKTEDPAFAAWDDVVEAWCEGLSTGAVKDEPMTVKHLAESNFDPFDHAMRSAIRARDMESMNLVRVGIFLKRYLDRIRNGVKLTSRFVKGQQKWQLVGWQEFVKDRKGGEPTAPTSTSRVNGGIRPSF